MSNTFRAALVSLTKTFSRRLTARSAITRLNELDDRTLNDIGLPRHAIASFVKAPSRRWDFVEGAAPDMRVGLRLVADRSAAADKAAAVRIKAPEMRRATL